MNGNIAIITARGGSKRIPRKNIRLFLGAPIIKYSILAALESGSFDEVMVSTDDEEIAGIAQSFGASVPFFRSNKNADDFATTADVLCEVLNDYSKTGREFENICCIYPTAPFITSDKLQHGMQLLKSSGADVVLPVTSFSYPIERCLRIIDGKAVMEHPKNYSIRSQDFAPAYHDAGQYYCLNVKAFLEQKKLFAQHTVPIVVSNMEVQDIDNINDWKIAEMKYQILHGG